MFFGDRGVLVGAMRSLERCIAAHAFFDLISRFGSVSAWRLVLGPECGDYHLHSLLKSGLAMCFEHSVSAGFVI